MPEADLPLFAYGTLMVPAIIEQVIGRVPHSEVAHIEGFQRFRVKDRTFPGILRSGSPRDRVEGLLYFDLSPAEWKFLNDYEDDFYTLEKIPARTPLETRDSLAYLVPPEAVHVLSSQAWDLLHFTQHHLSSYLA
jgi:hypothetical protein